MNHSNSDLKTHPATLAWLTLHPEYEPPHSISVLKPEHRKSAVYRLEGAGPGLTSVVAKRSRRDSALLERTLYETILPHIHVSILRYYGCLDEPEGDIWLFVEDAGEDRYLPDEVEHRALAARWLGIVHGMGSKLEAVHALPDRGPGHYLDALESAWQGISRNMDNPALSVQDRHLLDAIVTQCKIISSHWTDVEAFCARMPRTLVHGDFVGKNVRVRSTPSGLVLLPFDWESAGYGAPAPDLENVDPLLYLQAVAGFWPDLDWESAYQLSQVGRLFRLINFVRWASDSLVYPWVEKVMNNHMAYYHAWIDEALRAAKWG